MCILRYTPSSEPSASMTAAVLWYSPAARFSNSDAMMTALYFFASLRERVGRWAGDRLGEREEAVVFDLAEVLRAEQLLRAEDLRALLQRLLGEGELVGEVPLGILAARHLRKAYLDDRRLHGQYSNIRITDNRQGHFRYFVSSAFAYFPACIADRNSLFVFVLLIFESSSSIASTADSGVSTRRST